MVSLLVGWSLLLGISADPVPPTPALREFHGRWLADRAEAEIDRPLSRVWFSQFTIDGDQFRVSNLMGHPDELTGTFRINPTAQPKTIDLTFNELDFTKLGAPVKIPSMTLPGIYKFEGERLILCFTMKPGMKRPTEFNGRVMDVALLTLGRAEARYQGPPKQITVTVVGPDGKPVPQAMVYYVMVWNDAVSKKANDDGKWEYVHGVVTNSDGVAKLPYEEVGHVVRAQLDEHKLMGSTIASPFSLQQPTLKIQLAPSVRLTGTLVSDDLKKAGLPIGWTNTQIFQHGIPVASYMTETGQFDIPLPEGEYVIKSYGEHLLAKRTTINISANQRNVVGPINLSATVLPSLMGKPAPELTGVVGWKGDKIRLADLKGRYVLLEFWGYWCSPCVATMPVLFALHDQFKDQGLTVVGIHLDIEGEIDTAAKLDERLVDIRKRLWKNRDLPFPVALCSGAKVPVRGGELRGTMAERYGVLGYPTTILIDPEGKVVGKFNARDVDSAVAQVKKLFAK